MLWEISTDDASKDFVAIRATAGEIVVNYMDLEKALELVAEHNRAIECALCAGLNIQNSKD
ncbi:MAG: hypothetical protein ACK5L3_13710 [Oscillospiraceae bacterium]